MQSRWADFAITGVALDPEKKRIEQLEIREDEGSYLTSYQIMPRKEVIRLIIERQATFVTAYWLDGRWTKGTNVYIVRVSGDCFLRIDRQFKTKDDLGSLPIFGPVS